MIWVQVIKKVALLFKNITVGFSIATVVLKLDLQPTPKIEI